MLDACLLKPMSYCGLKYIHVYIFQRLELDAVSGHARFAQLFAIGFGQVFLVLDTHDVHRDSRRVGTHADLVKLTSFPIGIMHRVDAIPYVWIGNGFVVTVFPVQEPQSTRRHDSQNDAMQCLHVAAFGFRLARKVLLDLFVRVHGQLREVKMLQRRESR